MGNAAAKDVWFNSNQSAFLKPPIPPPESSNQIDSFTFNLSSLPGPIQIGSLAANESRLLQMKLLTPPRSGKNLIELIVYCEEDENGLYLPQSDGISLETEIVAPLELDLNILPAPVNCSKRALQGKKSYLMLPAVDPYPQILENPSHGTVTERVFRKKVLCFGFFRKLR